jgi:hypothetical protein
MTGDRCDLGCGSAALGSFAPKDQRTIRSYHQGMDIGRLLKWAVIIAVVVIVWKVVLPKLNGQKTDAGTSSSSPSAPGNDCLKRAEAASEVWGRSLGRFANPPYDISAWSSFRGQVDEKIEAAMSDCNCSGESCQKATAAMRDLRSLVSEMDSAIRGGSAPPDDAVQRQEQIDNQINEAADLVRDGK